VSDRAGSSPHSEEDINCDGRLKNVVESTSLSV